MCRALISFVMLLQVPFCALAAASPTPSALMQRIAAGGAQAVLVSVYSNDDEWHALLSGIASGNRAWLRVAVALHPVADAGASSQIKLAVGEALEHRPQTVLEIAVPTFTVKDICDGPDIDDKRYNSYNLAVTAIARREHMLSAASIPQLASLRDSCIQQLRESRLPIARFYGVQQ